MQCCYPGCKCEPFWTFSAAKAIASCPPTIMKATQLVEFRCSSYFTRSATIGTALFQRGLSTIFSPGRTRGDCPDVFGTKIKSRELISEVIDFLRGITVNDFVGMLRRRLEGLTIDSNTRDIIFAHQNVYALTEVVRYRLEDAGFSPFLNYLFGRLTADECRAIEAAKAKTTVSLERRFNLRGFKIGPDLDATVIEMSITINDKPERFEFNQQEFFGKLTDTCGNESIIPIERLRQQIASLDESG